MRAQIPVGRIHNSVDEPTTTSYILFKDLAAVSKIISHELHDTSTKDPLETLASLLLCLSVIAILSIIASVTHTRWEDSMYSNS